MPQNDIRTNYRGRNNQRGTGWARGEDNAQVWRQINGISSQDTSTLTITPGPDGPTFYVPPTGGTPSAQWRCAINPNDKTQIIVGADRYITTAGAAGWVDQIQCGNSIWQYWEEEYVTITETSLVYCLVEPYIGGNTGVGGPRLTFGASSVSPGATGSDLFLAVKPLTPCSYGIGYQSDMLYMRGASGYKSWFKDVTGHKLVILGRAVFESGEVTRWQQYYSGGPISVEPSGAYITGSFWGSIISFYYRCNNSYSGWQGTIGRVPISASSQYRVPPNSTRYVYEHINGGVQLTTDMVPPNDNYALAGFASTNAAGAFTWRGETLGRSWPYDVTQNA